jgi:hypothetical protein
MDPTPARPSVPSLIGGAFQHWADHQRLFWPVAGPCFLIFGGLRLAAERGWLSGSGSDPVVVLFAYAFAFYFWHAVTLTNDWKPLYRGGWPGAFILFCAAYGGVVFLVSLWLFFSLATWSPAAIIVMALAEAMVLLVVAGLFASFLLYLPAYVSGVRWSLAEAFRRAAGVRLALVALALFCTFLSLVGIACAVAFTALRVPQGPWANAVMRGFAVVIDLLALYVAAYGLSRLFIAQSGWQPDRNPTLTSP